MNTLFDWLQEPLAYQLGWTLLHFLWQGSLIALALVAVQVALKKRSADVRYWAACLALALLAAAPVVTFCSLPSSTSLEPQSNQASVVNSAPVQTAPEMLANFARLESSGAPTVLNSFSQTAEPILPWLTLVWFVGVCFFSLRLIGGWWKVQRLKRQQTEPLGEPWLGKFEELKQRLAITRPVRLLKSALVEVPTVIGWLKPVILLPASTLTGLSPTELESILAHELAHIRRNDYLVNLIQRVIETVLFYHPAVWWVSKCIREEREHCCDDLAVRACGDRLGYARALASLEELRSSPTELALAADGGSLTQRIRRLFGMPTEGSPIKKWRLLVLSLLGLVAAGVGFISVATQPLYVSEAKVLIRYVVEAKSVTAIGPDAKVTSPDRQGDSIINAEIEILTSRDLVDRVVDHIRPGRFLAKINGGNTSKEAASYMSQHLSIMVPRQSNVILVRFIHPDPEIVQQALDELIRVYKEKHQEMHGVGVAEDIISTQTDKLRTSIRFIDEEIRKLKGSAGIDFSIDDSKHAASEQIKEIRSALVATEADLVARRASLAFSQGGAGQPPNESSVPIEKLEKGGEYLEVMTELNILFETERQLSTRFTDAYPTLRSTRARITELSDKKKQLEKDNPKLVAVAVPTGASNKEMLDLVQEQRAFAALQAKLGFLKAQLTNAMIMAQRIERVAPDLQELERKKSKDDEAYKHFTSLRGQVNDIVGAGYSNIQVPQKATPAVKLGFFHRLWWSY